MSHSLIVALPIFIVSILLQNRASGHEQFSVAKYPNPTGSSAEDHWKCHVDRPGYVCDPDSLLNKTERMELVELADRFKEWTKMPNSDDFCAQQGVQLGIALSHHLIWRILAPGAYTLSELVEDTYDPCESIALKWGLRNENCSHYILIQMCRTNLDRNAICSNEAVPILVPEKQNILAAAKGRLSRGEFLPALKAIIGNLLQLIGHRQRLLIGEQALGPAIGTTATMAQTTAKPAATQTKAMTTVEPQSHEANLPPFFWLPMLLIGLFFCLLSLVAFLMALRVFIKLKQLMNSPPMMEMLSLNFEGGGEAE